MTTWTIDIIETGVIPHIPASAYLPDAPAGSYFDIPCYCYLLTAPDRCLLVDTGAHRAKSAAAGFEILGDGAAALEAALRRRGRRFEDVDAIIQTHLHYDHMQNFHLFPRSRLIVRRTELEWARSGEGGRFYVGIEELLTEAGNRLEVVEGEQEIFDGVTLLPNGGHCRGHQSILVRTDEGDVCLAADILPLGRNLEVLPPSEDPAATVAFQQRVSQSDWEVLAGHDPALRTHRWYSAD